MAYNVQLLCSNLARRGFIASYFDTAEEASSHVCSIIGGGSTIGIGGSMTVKEMGQIDRLAGDGNKVYCHALAKADKIEDTYKKAAKAQYYISSANALTYDGEIVNIDGAGNRVSALIYGVPHIIYVIGINKITDNIDSAIKRVRNVASPANTRRLNKKTPCAVTGVCSYCNSPDCICNVTTIMHHPMRRQQSVHVVLIGESLGY